MIKTIILIFIYYIGKGIGIGGSISEGDDEVVWLLVLASISSTVHDENVSKKTIIANAWMIVFIISMYLINN
jgi:hypothetical protein